MISKSIVIVGDVMLDVIVQPSAPIAPTSDTPATIHVGRGGSGANVAVVLAHAGHAVTYVGAVGDDAAGSFIRRDLEASSVRAQLHEVGAATGVVVAMIDREGQRAMMTDRGANRLLSRSEVLRALDQPIDHVHVSGYTLLDPKSRDIARAVLEAARDLAATTSIDVCSVSPLRSMPPEEFLACSAGASFLFANEEEALVMAQRDDVEDALGELALRYGEVLITRGPFGALARRDGTTWSIEAKSDEALDTTGAGDAATGAYLAARLYEQDVMTALDGAMNAAARVVKGLGSKG